MRLSEAIRLGAMLKPQGFGVSDNAREKSCALLAAANAVGLVKLHFTNQRWLDRWPWRWTERCVVPCPTCHAKYHVGGLIAHLNDVHRWTRERIADWVATVEPAEPVLEDRQNTEMVAAGSAGSD